jgi:hypothetical protein
MKREAGIVDISDLVRHDFEMIQDIKGMIVSRLRHVIRHDPV